MNDKLVEEARLLPVGEHECVTCERCALTFASVHPACPRCAAERRADELQADLQQVLEASQKREEWFRGRVDELREALKQARAFVAGVDLHGGAAESGDQWRYALLPRMDAALTERDSTEGER